MQILANQEKFFFTIPMVSEKKCSLEAVNAIFKLYIYLFFCCGNCGRSSLMSLIEAAVMKWLTKTLRACGKIYYKLFFKEFVVKFGEKLS
jgi:hypothetical protein